MNEDIDDLHGRWNLVIPLELQYACQYWMTHLSDTSHFDGGLLEDLSTFCHLHLFHWIEALSLLDKLSSAAMRLPDTVAWCKVSRRRDVL